ncbi:MAG: SDR family NAD(P)-dependent oxidoreductase, partial [Pseudomonadota bacterium]
MGLFEGKIVVITGAGGGLGRSYALAFAKEGAKVVVNDFGGELDGTGNNSKKMADAVVDEIKSAGGTAVANYNNVATMEGGQAVINAAVDCFGGLDVLVNNAGVLRDKTLTKMKEENWDKVIEVHLKGTFTTTKAAVTQMVKQGRGGRIINTSSFAGLKGNFGQSNYGAAKAGIVGFTRVLALELPRHNITVNCIAPMAKTRMTEYIDVIPDDMLPEHVAPLVLFLASEAAADINGRVFGAHGNHYFEYKLEVTSGVVKTSPWTVQEVGERIKDISSSAKAGDNTEKVDLGAQTWAVLSAHAECLHPERAGDWQAVIHFEVEGAGDFTLKISYGTCLAEKGKQDKNTCVVKMDAATLIGMATGEVDGQQAFMQGKITADNLPDMMKYATSFKQKKLMAMSKERLAALGGEKIPTTQEKKVRSEGLNRNTIGKTYDGKPDVATPESIKAYALATNDKNPRFLDESHEGGIVAPPMYAVRLNFDTLQKAATDPEVNADLLRLLHGEQDMRFFDLVRANDKISTRAEIAEIIDKASGQLLNIKITCSRNNQPIAETISTLFIRNKGKNASQEKTPDKAINKESLLFEENFHVDKDQSYRYAKASGDLNPLHVDDKIAKAAGLPGVVLQGLCSMAFCGQAIVNRLASEDPSRLARLKARFANLVFPGDTLTV